MAEIGAGEIGAMLPGRYGTGEADSVMHGATVAAVWNVQGDPAGAAIADVQRLIDISLPLVPNTARHTQALLVLWIGPRSWLLVEGGQPGLPTALVGFDAKRDALNAGGGALFDVCASRMAYTVRGTRAANVLARGCPLDFDARAFPAGHCAQSVFGRISALYYRHDRTPAFTVTFPRSLAADGWQALCAAAQTDGYEVAPPTAFDPG